MASSTVRRALIFLLAVPALAGHASTETETRETCARGGAGCAVPGLGSQVTQDDAGLEPAVDLLQKAMFGRKKDPPKIAEPTAHPESAHTARKHLVMAGRNGSFPVLLTDAKASSSHARYHLDPCSLLVSETAEEEMLPMVPTAKADLMALREVGLTQTSSSTVRTCKNKRTPDFMGFFTNRTTEEKNNLAMYIFIGWIAFAACIIAWSIWAVASVPRKPEHPVAHANKMNLANEEQAWQRGFLNWASLGWADDLMGRYGKCLHSVIDDRELIEDRMDEEYAPYVTFKKYWEMSVAEVGIQQASFFVPLRKVVGTRAILGLFLAIGIEVFMSNVGMVIALDKFLSHLEWMEREHYNNPEEPMSFLEPTLMVIIYIFGVPMFYRTATIIVHLLDGHYTNVCAAGLASIVFEKAMCMPVGSAPPDPTEEQVPGYMDQNQKPNVVQLLNVDIIECWGYLLKTMVYMIVSPCVTVVLFVMLINKIKLAGLMGVLYIIPCTLTTMGFMRFNIRSWIRYQGFQDERLRWLTETIIHIRTIKSLAWEKMSFEKLHKVRTKELEQNQICGIVQGFAGAIGHTMPWGTMLIAAAVSLRTEGYLEAHTIVIIQRMMGSLLSVTSLMLAGAHKFITVPNSFRRIRKFLAEHDLPEDVVRPPALMTPDAPVVHLHGSFSYVDGKNPVLHDLDVSIKQGEFVAVVGAVASGKSAFLQTILGELYPVDEAYVEAPMPGKGQIAYCSQVPWIFEGTLRDNVLLSSGLVAERYYSALYSAALMGDLEILPGGDQVTIGSYGIRLSGGQRARVALARAAYQEQAHVVVIDDPFASVDMPTGQHICTELLLGPLMQGRTRIVVMQPNPQKLKHADRVILLEAGKVAAIGTPQEVMATKSFQDLMAQNDEETQIAATLEAAEGGLELAVQRGGGGGERTARLLERKASEAANVLREQEAQDHVTWATCIWWLKAAGFFNLGFFFGMMILGRWVGLWEQLSVARWVDAKVYSDVNDGDYIIGCISIVACNCVVIAVMAYASTRVMMSASTRLHAKVIHAILRAPIDKFFDKQPIGRLINRLSFDMRKVDDAILGTITTLLGFLVGFIVTESFILRVVPWRIALMSGPVFLGSFFFIYIFRGTAVPLVFHSKFALSTVQDLQATVLTSCVSIRANSMFDGFMSRFNHYSHSVIRCHYLIFHVCACWVQSRVFLCFSCLTCLFAVGGLWSNMPLGTLSLVIAQQYGQMSEFENLSGGFTAFLNIMNALQRLAKYFDAPQEAAEHKEGDIDVRKRANISRAELVQLEVRMSDSAEDAVEAGKERSEILVCKKGGKPVLRSSADGRTLHLVEGCTLGDLAPSNKALQEIGQDYDIVGVNSVNRRADQMAQELCTPTSMVYIDLWHSNFSQGMRVQIEALTAGYNSEKNVLHGICIDIAPCMKMGFAGKTGCGKSTTMLCLLRLLEPRGGRVLFGGMDSGSMGLAALRSMIGLVPQDPTIFEGTIRTNIDPFDEYPDARIWECLRSMQLLPWVRQQNGGINSGVVKEGGNMSFGQRQLLSMARMVIRQPPVLLLDECTSALDPNTQQVVQDTILHEFPMTTVIAIAHRVETILDFDKICVFDNGRVAEQGTISEVLSIEKGLFADMVRIAKPDAIKSKKL